MTNAEYLKMLRARAKVEGKCSVCRARPARPYKMTCQECVDRAAQVQKRTKGKLCRRCYGSLHGSRHGMSFCNACSVVLGEAAQERRRNAVKAGMCAKCKKRPLSTDTLCSGCADNYRDRAAAKDRLNGSPPKPCGVCGVGGHNRTTHERYVERSKAWSP